MSKEYTYKENEESFFKYIEECKAKIEKLFFDEQDLKNGYSIKNELIAKEKIDKNTSIPDAIKAKRKELIEIKIDHTMRIVNDSSRIAKKVGASFDFEKILKIAALLHDIGRFDQAVYDNDFIDKNSRLFNPNKDGKIIYHGDYGHDLLANSNFKGYNIPDEYKYAILQVVKHHQDNILPNNLNQRFENIKQLDTNLLTGNNELSEPEQIVISALVQMVKDVDMLDILYQNATGEFNVIIPYIKKPVNNMTLDDFSKIYGVSTKDLMEANKIDNEDISKLDNILIPTAKITNIQSLIVPQDIQKAFFNKEKLDLKVLMNRSDWSFIVGMWWRLNQFLLKINFTSNLEVIKENELLETIYNQYPDRFKPLVFSAFEYAQQELLEKTLKHNEGNIYISR